MNTKDTQEMNKRFDEQFVKQPVDWRENHGWTVPYVDSRADKLLDFIQSEIDLAVREERERITKLIKTIGATGTEEEVEKLISLINN